VLLLVFCCEHIRPIIFSLAVSVIMRKSRRTLFRSRDENKSILEGYVGVAMLMHNEYPEDEQGEVGPFLKPLPWTKEDADQVEKLFKLFNYYVYRCKNVRNSNDLFEKCCRVRALFIEHSAAPPTCNRIFVYFSGHGGIDKFNKQFLMLQNGKEYVDLLIAYFSEITKENMVKMFFIDACSLKTAENVKAEAEFDDRPLLSMCEENVLVANATSCNLEAYQDGKSSGSRWTSCLVQALEDSKEDDSVYDVLTTTQKLMKEKNQSQQLQQVPKFESTLINKVKFKKEALGKF